MALIDKYTCKNCSFEFEYKDLIFYFDDDLEKITIKQVTKSSLEKAGKSSLSGRIDEAYCRECDDTVRVYIITDRDNYTSLTNDKIREKIDAASEDELYRIYFWQDDRSRDNNEDICPKCGKVLTWISDDSLCPKCGNELKLDEIIVKD